MSKYNRGERIPGEKREEMVSLLVKLLLSFEAVSLARASSLTGTSRVTARMLLLEARYKAKELTRERSIL